MKSTPRAGRRRKVFSASARSAGGPQIPRPTMRIAPKPRRLTSKAPPMRKRPDSSALVTVGLRGFHAERSGPAGQRRHRGQYRSNVAAGLQAEDRAAIIEQVELYITS